MDKKKQCDNIAKEFNIGKTRVKICKDYCVENPLEVKKILNNLSQNIFANLNISSLK